MTSNKYNPLRDTPEYQAGRHDDDFQNWLRTQETTVETEFIRNDVPELAGHLYTREGLVIAEQQMLLRFPTAHDMFSEENLEIGLCFFYAVGETFRRALDGTWAVLPPNPPDRPDPLAVVEAPMWTAFHDIQHTIGLAFDRRSGQEISWIYDRAVKRHQKWVDAGRPARDDE
ncbi:hypothetical protein [Nocardia paucivorans]|uniref:hypothetical protein n=1 Tax=Nocardia paucivorans TaxID=114259 RepID=UPI0002FC41C9|nr:hypothetical protein [Nocardia paucivorans]